MHLLDSAPLRVILPLCGIVAMIGGCRDATEPAERRNAIEVPPIGPALTVGKQVGPQMDAYIRSDAAHKNYGSNDSLLIRAANSGMNRILLAFSQAGITDSLADDSLVSASLEVTIKRNGNDWGTSGRSVAAHRMTRAWTEGGATWNCANDTNVSNNVADCPGNSWTMASGTRPFATTPVSQTLISNNQTGVVTFDVTADVRAFLSGQAPNLGWMLKLAVETQSGTVVFHARESASKPRLVLSVTHQQGVPAHAPDTLASWVYSASNLDSNTAALPGVFLKNVVIVEFKSSATTSQRQAAVDSVHGAVVGGVPSSAGEGHYYLRVPDSTGGGGLVSAVQKLERLSQVQLATYEIDVAPMYRRPVDDANWSSWHVDRKSLTGQNWALEAVLAPMAWGCTTGDGSVKVAVVDGGFPTLAADHDVTITVHPAPGGGNPLSGAHGIGVSSILAARGNNQKGMTGMMWNADLHGYEVGEIGGNGYGFVGRVLQQIKNAADDGARIVNLSLSVRPQWDDSTRALAGRGLDSTLSALGARGKRPLLVIAAGNYKTGADTAGFPRASEGQNADQVIVVAASTKDSVLWVSSEPGGGGSNYGSLVTVAAPGKGVFFMNQTGAIINGDGTSASAPIVSGIAGLLLSFDSRLKASDLKSLIVDGANAGGWKATRTAGGEQYNIVNAYESLKLAARRRGAPLCGNRLWATPDSLMAERSDGDETLYAQAGSSFGVQLQSFHDGHFVNFFGFQGLLQWTAGRWAPAANFPPDLTESGSTLSPRGLSHDGDTVVATRQVSFNPNPVMEVTLRIPNGPQLAQLTTFQGFQVPGAYFSPTGKEVVVPVRQVSPEGGANLGTDVYAVAVPGGQSRMLYSLPGGDLFFGYAAVSEDGKELVAVASGRNFCRIDFRSMADGSLLRPSITFPYTNGTCTAFGVMAP